MDIIEDKVQKAMKTLATALVREKGNNTRLIVDYERELIVFNYRDNWVNVNCKYDSQAAAIKDFAKQLLTQIEL